jgi:regulator of RNase E activity RraA
MGNRLTYAQLLKLKRWNTPTIYNGWEAYTKLERTKGYFNRDPVTDYMPTMGNMVGYAVTVVCEPSNQKHTEKPGVWKEYRKYIASLPGPKIVVVKDLDDPNIGAFWGEVNANVHRALGCVGTITQGAIRDLDEMHNAGFKALASRLCVGHAYSTPVSWGEEVEVFGCKVKTGDLIHADKHGFLVVPPEDWEQLYDAASFMDANECDHLLNRIRLTAGMTTEETLAYIERGFDDFDKATVKKFGQRGEF